MIIRDTVHSPMNVSSTARRSLLSELRHPDKVAGAQELECSIAHAIIPPVDPEYRQGTQVIVERFYKRKRSIIQYERI